MAMTKQEIFNRVKTHLLTQAQKSIKYNRCLYRGSGGRKCAIGCLITDEAYFPSLEGCSVTRNVVINALVKSGVIDDPIISWQSAADTNGSMALLADLQAVHDLYNPEYWESELKRVEQSWHLTCNHDFGNDGKCKSCGEHRPAPTR